MRLLIIEDDKYLASSMKKGLEKYGFYVDVSNLGREGEEKAYVNQYDAVLLDLNLPDKNGTEILALKNILYIESCKHYLRIKHINGECEMRGKISNLEKWMSNYGFVQTHRSYLVNVRYMKMVRANEVELDNGEILSVSRDKAQEVKKKQMIYLRSFAYANS